MVLKVLDVAFLGGKMFVQIFELISIRLSDSVKYLVQASPGSILLSEHVQSVVQMFVLFGQCCYNFAESW